MRLFPPESGTFSPGLGKKVPVEIADCFSLLSGQYGEYREKTLHACGVSVWVICDTISQCWGQYFMNKMAKYKIWDFLPQPPLYIYIFPNQNSISPAVTKDSLFKNFSNAVASATDFDAIKSVCKSFHHDMIKFPCPTYPNKIKDFTPDLVTAGLNPDKNMTLVCVIGDGNCLPRCASILVYGHEQNHKEM